MDNIGDFLYLILIVIAGVGGLLKKNGKSKKPTAEEVLDDEPINTGDILRELFDMNKPQTHPEVEPQKKSIAINDDALYSQEVIPSTFNKSEIKPIAKKESKKTTDKIKESEITDEVNYSFDLRELNDARAAFISSEIFNRKY